jgi:hypothetical protein
MNPAPFTPSFPRKHRAVRGKSCGRIAEQIDPRISSWPGLSRPSTPSSARNKDVDARIKSAQDELRLISVRQKPVIVADIISLDSPARQRESRNFSRLLPVHARGRRWTPAFAGAMILGIWRRHSFTRSKAGIWEPCAPIVGPGPLPGRSALAVRPGDAQG